MYLARVSGRALPVNVGELMNHLRQPQDDLVYLEAILASAHDTVAELTGRTLGNETWDVSLGAVSGDLVLPKNPVQSITSISFFDAAGVTQTADVADFLLFKGEDRATIRPKEGKAWPTLQKREDALTVRFVAGYSDLPPALRVAILFAAESIYDRSPFPPAMEVQIAAYRLGWISA